MGAIYISMGAMLSEATTTASTGQTEISALVIWGLAKGMN